MSVCLWSHLILFIHFRIIFRSYFLRLRIFMLNLLKQINILMCILPILFVIFNSQINTLQKIKCNKHKHKIVDTKNHDFRSNVIKQDTASVGVWVSFQLCVLYSLFLCVHCSCSVSVLSVLFIWFITDRSCLHSQCCCISCPLQNYDQKQCVNVHITFGCTFLFIQNKNIKKRNKNIFERKNRLNKKRHNQNRYLQMIFFISLFFGSIE